MGSAFENPKNFGYNQPVKQAQQTLSQSSSIVNDKLNNSRPERMQLPSGTKPIYGTNAEFFGQQVPRVIPPEWNFMRQPDESLYPVGAPFYGYPTPISAFGKKMRRYRKSNRSACSGLKKKACGKSAMCKYVKSRGCRRSKKASSHHMSGDDDLGAYAEAAGISFFGKKRRIYNY